MKNTSNIPLSDLKLLVKEVIRESLTDRSKSDYVGLPLKPIGKLPEKGKGELKGSGLLKALKPKDKKVNESGLTSEAGVNNTDLLEIKESLFALRNIANLLLKPKNQDLPVNPSTMLKRLSQIASETLTLFLKSFESELKMTDFDPKIEEGAGGAEDPMSVISQITANIGDDATIARLNPEVAKKKLTVIRSILNSLVAKSQQGQQPTKQVAEGGPQYKQVSPNETDTAKEDKAREIQCDPKVNEASYKVVAPKASTDAKEDKARRIQTEPKVNEGQENFCSCKGCGRVVDKGTEKCPKCREKQDKTSLPPKKNERGAKRPADVNENDGNADKLRGKIVQRGTIKLQGGMKSELASKIANHHWDVMSYPIPSENGVWNFKTRGDRWCCSVGMLNGEPAMLSSMTDGNLELLVGNDQLFRNGVNETAYKVQGPSYKTFDQSPQLPSAVNDPTNA